MAASSLIRLLTALLMLTGLALSSSLAWAQQQEDPYAPPPQQEQPQEEPEWEREPEPDPWAEPEPRPRAEPVTVDQPSFFWPIARNAVIGGVLGAGVGTGLYFLTGQDWSPWTIAYFGGGGVALGATVGLIESLTRDDVAAMRSVEWMERDMPTTYQLPIMRLQF